MGNMNKHFGDEEINQLLKEHIPNSFGNNFTSKVMSRIRTIGNTASDLDIFVDALSNQFKRFALIGSLVIIFIISYNIFSKGEVTLAKALDIPDYTLEDAYDPINSYQWSKE